MENAIVLKARDIWSATDGNYRYLRLDRPVVLLFDGKSVTRDHKRYNMIQQNSIPQFFSNCALRVANRLNLDCTIYVAGDEISIIVSRPDELIRVLDIDDHADYALCMVLQMLLTEIHQKYPEMYLKGTIFSINAGDIKYYLEERRIICREVAIGYYAKEYLDKKDYVGLNTEALIQLLKAKGYYDQLLKNTELYDGILTEYKKQSPLDLMLSCFE